MTISIFGLLASGWLLAVDPILFWKAQDYHFIFSALLVPALILRLYLLFFGKGTDLLADCEIDPHRMSQAWQVMRFYLTLGRTQLPRWYSHNPLWGPLYLLLFLFLVLSAISGIALSKEATTLITISMHDLHRLSYYFIVMFTLLHLTAVFSHDLSGKGADVSAMINGYRIFYLSETQPPGSDRRQSVPLTDLSKQ
jgi:Ni/Fe-hydrogenase 1 B-type cytochrome subunit